jgi:hypothetical protein
MVQRVVIHVGCPKTGTTGIQHRLFMNPKSLAAQGFLYPSERADQHFLAAVDVLEIKWGSNVSADAVDAWDHLAEAARASELNVIISHELLARATPEQIERITSSFGDADVSVVITARDLGRLVPAEYQEHLKYRNVFTYATFIDRLKEPEVDDRAGELARLTWGVQDVPALAARWAAVVGSDHVTVVTVPTKGAPRDELIHRFGEAVGLDPDQLDPNGDGEDKENRSLGAAEVEWLRRFNERYGYKMKDPKYSDFVRNRLVERLGHAEGETVPLVLPQREFAWVEQRARDWVEALRTAGYRVVGDLAELIPAKPADEAVDPDSIDDAELFETGLAIVVGSLDDYADLVTSIEPAAAVARTVPERLKGRVVRAAEKRAIGQRALGVWRARH